MSTILHVSDLHFGHTLNPAHEDKLTNDEGAVKFADKIFDTFSVTPGIDDTKIEAIVITGDISDNGNTPEFKRAEIFISHLLDKFKLNPERLIIIPGNHDVNWTANKLQGGAQYDDFTEFYDRVKGSSYRKLMGHKWNRDHPDIVEFDLEGLDSKAVIFGFDSVSVESKLWQGLGYIRAEQPDNARIFLKSRENQYSLRLAALHHHIFPVHDYVVSYEKLVKALDEEEDKGKNTRKNLPPPVSIMMNAPEFLVKCANMKIDALLHGHSHSQFIAAKTQYFQNYDETGAEMVGRERNMARSTIIIGCGSASYGNPLQFPRTQFQLISFKRLLRQKPFIEVKPYVSSSNKEVIEDAHPRRSIIIPLGRKTQEVEPERVEELHTLINRVLASDSHPGIYDNILKEYLSWVSAVFNINVGCVTLAKHIPGLKLYRNFATYHYDNPKIKNIVYNVDDTTSRPGITATAAKLNRSIIIPKRSVCEFATSKYNDIYRLSIGGADQTVLAIPLNSANAENPYAILVMSRARLDAKNEFGHEERLVIESTVDILEDAMQKADQSQQAGQKTLNFFRRMAEIAAPWDSPSYVGDPQGALDMAAKEIKAHFNIDETRHEAVGIFLPTAATPDTVRIASQIGFEKSKNKMKYSTEQRQGLTGGIITHRKPDFSINHLAPGKRSELLGSVSSGQCLKVSGETLLDHDLSFVGVPFGRATNTFNKGAIILNIASPAAISSHDRKQSREYFENKFLDPLLLAAKLLEPLVENGWQKKCQEQTKEIAAQSLKSINVSSEPKRTKSSKAKNSSHISKDRDIHATKKLKNKKIGGRKEKSGSH